MKTGETAPFTSKVTLFKVKSQYLKMRYHFLSLSLFPRVWTSELVSCHVSGHICVVVAWCCIGLFSSFQGESDLELASLLYVVWTGVFSVNLFFMSAVRMKLFAAPL